MAINTVLSDEEEGGENEYEKNGPIAEDVDEDVQDGQDEDRAGSDVDRQRKKKRKQRDSEKNCVQDNVGSRHPKVESKKFEVPKKARTLYIFGNKYTLLYGDEEEEDRDTSETEDEMDDSIVDEPTRRRKVNKKKSRQAPGISSTAIQEAHELSRQRKLGLERIRRLEEEEVEPIIISEKCVTENDDRIREIDIPERMQISEESTGPPPADKRSIDEESNWILYQLWHERAVVKEDIVRFLEFMHVHKLDVPFIAMYRKEECKSLFRYEGDENNPEKEPMMRWHKVLWQILELDKKWLLLQKRKSALQSYYNKRFEEERNIYNETRLHLNQKLFKSITKSLKVAESERETDDVDSKFNLHYPPGDVGVDEQYSICSKSGPWEVASKFGCSSEEFGMRIMFSGQRGIEIKDLKETPEEVASRFTCAMFETPQAVLRGARHMAAVEISYEPWVRKHVRSIFMGNAVVSTRPIADGNVSIDLHHQFSGIKWLKNKPLTRFDDAQWLLIQKAEEEKLIQVSVKLPASTHNKLFNDAREFYISARVSKSAQLWNEQRWQIIKDAFDGLLLPSMAKEARALLTSRAKNWLLTEYGRLLWDKVTVAPYQKMQHDIRSLYDFKSAPRVMACCWGPGKPATTFVMLDPCGEVLDVLYAGSLTIRGQSENDQQRKKHDQQRLTRFMTDHQPNVVVLGAVNKSCTRLVENIYESIFSILEDGPRDVSSEMDDISVVYADETLPHLYENSCISSDQLQPQSGIVRCAVALGRYLQNPLAMVATLCGPAKEILSWKLNPLESFLTSDEKYGMVEQVMVDATNQVGLDVNLAISHEWLFAPLQFISGLGPRKAASLQKSLVRASSIYTRKDLLTLGLGKKVFVNAVGFLRVRRIGNAASSSQFIDLLDDTRIHPESYGLAQELAKDIYIVDAGDDVNDDEDLPEMAIKHVRENPQLLKRLSVDAYARSKKRENKKDTLNHTRLELIQGFQDWRKPYARPKFNEVLYMLYGETEETLSKGKIVQATVRSVQPQRAVCVLKSGLVGMLSNKDHSDERENDLTERFYKGDVLTCMIKSIEYGRHPVFLSCRDSDLRSARSQHYKTTDPYYHKDHDNSETDDPHYVGVGPPIRSPAPGGPDCLVSGSSDSDGDWRGSSQLPLLKTDIITKGTNELRSEEAATSGRSASTKDTIRDLQRQLELERERSKSLEAEVHEIKEKQTKFEEVQNKRTEFMMEKLSVLSTLQSPLENLQMQLELERERSKSLEAEVHEIKAKQTKFEEVQNKRTEFVMEKLSLLSSLQSQVN